MNGPRPPYLVIRKSVAFWVETRPDGKAAATRQAVAEGCYVDVQCYDVSGQWWPVLTATVTQNLAARLLPWRRVAVQLEFGSPVATPVSEVVLHLASILRAENEFCEHLSCPPSELLEQLQRADSPAALIAIASIERSAA